MRKIIAPVIISIIVMITGIFFLYYIVISKAISRPIRRTADMLKNIAEGEGDLTKRIDVQSKDETGTLYKWFNSFLAKLNNIILQVRMNTEEVATASNEISAASAEMAAGAEEQSSQSAQVAASVQQMTAAILQSSQNAAQAAIAEELTGRLKI